MSEKREIRVGLAPNPDKEAKEPYYVAVVMEFDTYETQAWYNTGMVAHGFSPHDAFNKAYEMVYPKPIAVEDPFEGMDSKDIYLRKDGQIIGLHAIGENQQWEHHHLDGTVELKTGFQAHESWGNEYDNEHNMLGRGSFRVFQGIDELAKELVVDGWEIYEGPKKPKV